MEQNARPENIVFRSKFSHAMISLCGIANALCSYDSLNRVTGKSFKSNAQAAPVVLNTYSYAPPSFFTLIVTG